VRSLLDDVQHVAGANVLAADVQATDMDMMREMADRFRDKLGSAVVALGSVVEDKPLLLVALTQDMIKRGLHAGKIAGAAAKRMGGGGGGRPDIAQAGGREAENLGDALQAVVDLVREALA